ncbi:GntR family transcriptional regulator [Bacillus mojavensis]|uniref:GntR family transcriptional regulator n=1 Tax=Bacillus mojavensis TaxID=72360 RepID=UPI002E083154|nr:GntR family transcriptional regulator [Bacillus mojavensis]
MLNNGSSTPLYIQLKQIITDDIKKGLYSPAAKLPTENELCSKYNVSRITVRKAILDLVEEGYLIRQQGKGTFVKSPKLKRELIAVNGYSEFMESTGKKPKHQVLSHEIIPASKPIAEKLQIKTESPVVELKRILYNDDQPLTFEITHYPLELFPAINTFIADGVSMHDILNTKLLNVVYAQQEESKYLDCDIGDALFEIDKTAFTSNDQPIYCSLFLMHTNRVTFTINSPYT